AWWASGQRAEAEQGRSRSRRSAPRTGFAAQPPGAPGSGAPATHAGHGRGWGWATRRWTREARTSFMQSRAMACNRRASAGTTKIIVDQCVAESVQRYRSAVGQALPVRPARIAGKAPAASRRAVIAPARALPIVERRPPDGAGPAHIPGEAGANQPAG